jgi:UDP-N-acetylmuramoyl-L-alanyl-D-glutamate--2,6-diaminopimelate ligase
MAYLGAIRYGFPSRKMTIIGITGTKGKTSTAYFVWNVLQHAGIKTGMLTTAAIKIGDKDIVNTMHMTMPGRFFIQKHLRMMVDAGCEVAIVETTSQGIVQHRHRGIAYDIAVFTNLSPEHIESHGSYEAYREAKGKLFKTLSHARPKKWKDDFFSPTSILNYDDREYVYYSAIKAPRQISYGLSEHAAVRATHVLSTPHTVSFSVDQDRFDLSLPGTFMIPNALVAITIADLLNLPRKKVSEGVHSLTYIPGRMEEIKTNKDFRVFIDYAHEKLSMRALITNLKQMAQGNKVIVVFGSEGGGRDKSKRKDMAQVVAELADYAVVSDTDPYDEDPDLIVEEIGQHLAESGLRRDEQYFLISNRRSGIRKALSLAQSGDIVVCTAMGAQETMIRENGKAYPWSEREVVREELLRV